MDRETYKAAMEQALELLPTVVLQLEQRIKDVLESESPANIKGLLATVHETHVAFERMCGATQLRIEAVGEEN